MSSLKRAKWIEGITQSKRILRDIAEIVTSAIRDEDGKVTDENWKMVYPRPFTETPITRGVLVKNQASPTRYTPVLMQMEQATLTGTTGAELKHKNVLESSIVVKSTDGTKTFAITTDYTYDPVTNSIARPASGSTITSGQTVIVTYGTKFFNILESVPAIVERKLTLADPDRQIPSADYVISDYVAGKVKFNQDPPTDALKFMLTYTERRSVYDYVEHDKLDLEIDPLDGLGRTFQIPGTHGEIMLGDDTRTVSQAAAGGLTATGEAPYTIDPLNKSIIFDTAPILRVGDKLLLTVYIYNDSTFQQDTRWARLELVKDATDATDKTYKVNGSFQKFNEGKAHSVEMYTKNTAPVFWKNLDANNAGFEIVPEDAYTINHTTTEINFAVEQSDQVFVSFTARGEDDPQVGLSKVTDRIVLKTITTPENEYTPVIGEDYGAKDTATELEMYVEITKPARLINPETGLERYTTVLGNQAETQDNNHFIQMRMFDEWDDSTQSYMQPKYSSEGIETEKGAFVSDWTKYAWFKDWKESLVDELDDDPGVSDINKGIILHEVVTKGMSDEFPVQFWISTNNNRLAIILMGDPTLDQDNFLTSFAYAGRVHPFYDTHWVVKRDDQGQIVTGPNGDPVLEENRTFFENDVSGNFAMTSGSSTIPAAIGIPPKGQPVIKAIEVNKDGSGIIAGDLYDFTAFSYLITYITDGGESKPTRTTDGRLIVNKGLVVPSAVIPTKGLSMKLTFTVPEEAIGYRVYRFHETSKTAFTPTDVINPALYRLVASADRIGRERDLEVIDDGKSLPMVGGTGGLITNMLSTFYANYASATSTARSFKSVVRDRFTGAILSVKFTDKWGVETATGVNDVMMYQTRSGLKFQRHQPSFITTEQYMRKEKSGQSRWTGKFHLSPIYLEHGYDKQRGWFDGVMAVDDSGIEHLDELIVDKDLPTEEVYKFFRINAPFSFLNNSPNYAYGLAIIKSSQKWN